MNTLGKGEAMELAFQQADPLDLERKKLPEGKDFTHWFQSLLMKCKTTMEREVLRKTINPLWLEYQSAVKQQREENGNGSDCPVGH